MSNTTDLTTAQLLDRLNAMRVYLGMRPRKTWKQSHEALVAEVADLQIRYDEFVELERDLDASK